MTSDELVSNMTTRANGDDASTGGDGDAVRSAPSPSLTRRVSTAPGFLPSPPFDTLTAGRRSPVSSASSGQAKGEGDESQGFHGCAALDVEAVGTHSMPYLSPRSPGRRRLRPNSWIVVPLYNEAPAVRETVEKLLPIGGRIVVVDDGSNDGGVETLAGLPVVLIRHPFNLGQGAALATGFQYALDRGAEYVATFDSDGQYLAGDLVAMQDFLVGEAVSTLPSLPRRVSSRGQSADPGPQSPAPSPQFDIVTGSRFLGRTVGMPFLRRLLVRSSRWLAWALYGVRLTDTQNGVRMMNRRAAEKMRFTQNRMAHAMEAHGRVAEHRLRHTEFPNTMVYTEYSRSKGQGNVLGSLNILADLLLAKL